MLTFREFYQICEGKKPDTPPHAVPGTVNRDSSGTLTYTLQRYDGPKGLNHQRKRLRNKYWTRVVERK
jgi:hypothetical protein